MLAPKGKSHRSVLERPGELIITETSLAQIRLHHSRKPKCKNGEQPLRETILRRHTREVIRCSALAPVLLELPRGIKIRTSMMLRDKPTPIKTLLKCLEINYHLEEQGEYLVCNAFSRLLMIMDQVLLTLKNSGRLSMTSESIFLKTKLKDYSISLIGTEMEPSTMTSSSDRWLET